MLLKKNNRAWKRSAGLAVGTALVLAGAAMLPFVGTAAAASGQVLPSPSDPNPAGYARGYTKPSDQADLAFPTPGVVAKVAVKAGEIVEKGKTVIAQQNDLEEQAALVAADREIESAQAQILAAQADLEKKRVDLARVEKVYKDEVAAGTTNSELDEARVNVKIGEIALEFRKTEKKAAEAKRDQAQVKVDQRKLISPISGVVAKVDLHAGEGTDIQRPAGIQLVQNNPLWVEARIPTAKADALQNGQTLKVYYFDNPTPLDAKVIFLSPVADAGMSVRLVRLELPNPKNRESGLPIFVSVPDNLAGQAARAK